MEICKKNISLDFWMGYLQCLFDSFETPQVQSYGKDYNPAKEDWQTFYEDGLTPEEAIEEDLSNL